jgi:hypothetical protein
MVKKGHPFNITPDELNRITQQLHTMVLPDHYIIDCIRGFKGGQLIIPVAPSGTRQLDKEWEDEEDHHRVVLKVFAVSTRPVVVHTYCTLGKKEGSLLTDVHMTVTGLAANTMTCIKDGEPWYNDRVFQFYKQVQDDEDTTVDDCRDLCTRENFAGMYPQVANIDLDTLHITNATGASDLCLDVFVVYFHNRL